MRIFGVFIFIVWINFGYADWEAIGPYGGTMRTLAISAINDNLVYCSNYANPSIFFRSTNGGTNWIRRGQIADYAYCLALDPTNDNILYSGAYQSIHKSTDGGNTWGSSSVSTSYIYGIVVNPLNPSIVYAVGQMLSSTYYVSGFFRSTNGGSTWSALPLHTIYTGFAYCITLDPANPNIIYIGAYNYNAGYFPKVYKSTNGGASFNDVSTGISASGMYVMSLAVNPGNSSIVYAGTYYGGIYRSTNSGTSWTIVEPAAMFATGIATSPAASNIAYTGCDTLIYKTTDNGATWAVVGGSFLCYYKSTRNVAACRTNASVVHTVDSKGCFKTTNGGNNWCENNNGIAIGKITTLDRAPSAPATLYTEMEGYGVLKTTDNGVSWSLLPTPLDCGTICEFAIHNTNANEVYGLEGMG